MIYGLIKNPILLERVKNKKRVSHRAKVKQNNFFVLFLRILRFSNMRKRDRVLAVRFSQRFLTSSLGQFSG
ncbi:hypothetical protein MACH09_42160 [Vibrio sp. MACH09]|nr:hypothetical protein MACH09_42160 [Vibrio sp. MACH09]